MKKIWPFLFYFLYYAAVSGVFPFAALYYQSVGLSGTQVGLLLGVAPLVALLGGPLLTGMADKTQRHKLVLSLALVAVILWSLAVPFTRSFPVLLLLILFYSLASSPINSLADSATMTMLGEERAMYGRVRLGGSIGWGLMAYITGLIVERNGLVWIFGILAIGMALNLLVVQKFSFGEAEERTPFLDGVSALLSNRRWMLFLGIALVAGLGMATINTYQFVYMSEIGASKTLMGLSLTISTLSELPAMFFGDRLLKRFKPQGLLVLGTAIIGARLLLYATFNFPVAILVIQVIHGLTFPIIWVAGVSYAHENAPAGLSATAQGLFGAAIFGIGSGLGSFLGGLALDNLGGRGMYFAFGGFVLLALVIFSVFQNRNPQAHPKSA
jgi:MFS transporter, PPP family, 3-phenylpropionic acid transporter